MDQNLSCRFSRTERLPKFCFKRQVLLTGHTEMLYLSLVHLRDSQVSSEIKSDGCVDQRSIDSITIS